MFASIPGTYNVMKFKFHITFKLHQKSYRKVVDADFTGTHLSRSCWVVAAVARHAELSVHSPVAGAVPMAYVKVFRGLATNVSWLQVARVRLEQLDMATVVKAFELVDLYLADASGFTPGTRFRTSMSVRVLLRDFAVDSKVAMAFGGRALYRTPHTKPNSSRKMISDDVTAGMEVSHPIGAIPFENSEQLKSKAIFKVEGILSRIEMSAVKELDELDAKHQKYSDLLCPAKFSAQIFEKLKAYCAKPGIQKLPLDDMPAWLRNISVPDLASMYYRIYNDALAGEVQSPVDIYCPRTREINEWFVNEGLSCNSGIQLAYEFLSKDILESRSLHACLIILQKHTGWNVNSVLEMTAKGIESNGTDGFVIQGYKSRIKETTPFVEVLKTDVSAHRAVRLLVNRLEAMKKIRWVPQSEGRLWLNQRLAKAGILEQFVSWHRIQLEFCKKYALPNFSLEQIRVEVLGLHALKAGGLEAAMKIAGHSEMKTTASYLDQMIMRRINSAQLLEFEKRLESCIRFRMKQEDSLPYGGDLLYHIGGGVSCSDPFNPPIPAYVKNAVCEGDRCNAGDGCANRRIVIDPVRVEEIFRLDYFYIGNWRNLLNRNPSHFAKVHVANIVVNRTLISILEKSEYRTLVRKIRKVIHE